MREYRVYASYVSRLGGQIIIITGIVSANGHTCFQTNIGEKTHEELERYDLMISVAPMSDEEKEYE